MVTSTTTPDAVDLNNCDREPIHLAGQIQPHGGLLAFHGSDLRLRHYSENIGVWLRRIPAVGALLDEVFDVTSTEALRAVAKGVPGVVRPLRLRWRHALTPASFIAAAHIHHGMLIVELEMRSANDSRSEAAEGLSLPLQVSLASQKLQRCQTLPELYQAITDEMQALNGFDRVMLYRFSDGGHGEVIGESAREGLDRFLGLHYPATDIPQQARRLYVLNTVRGIADVNAQPIGIFPPCDANTRTPLDLSFSCHRAVSPIHVEYLRNMGVCASMSIFIVDKGTLWGLIACHHYSPKPVWFEERAICEIMGLAVSNYLIARESEQIAAERDARRRSYHHVLETITQSPRLIDSVTHIASDLLTIVPSNGIALISSHGIRTVGSTPSNDALRQLVKALPLHRQIDSTQWSSNSLRRDLPDWATSQRIESAGCLAIPLVERELDWLLFFRNEFVREVSWAGNPQKAISNAEEGVRLSPRLSFEAWKQVVTGESRPWSQVDREMAAELRSGLLELLSLRAAELIRINDELARINTDLDTFAYAASHDLREPLRGIQQAVFLLENELDPKAKTGAQNRLSALSRLASRMDDLVDGLLRLSRAGRGDLKLETITLSEIVFEAAEMVVGRPVPRGIEIVPVSECTFVGDFLCVRELFSNLISNAVKYNRNVQKRVEVGVVPRPTSDARPLEFFVRDNGIGIAPKFHLEIFQIFRRLHLSDEYGGGSGAGLTIAKKIVDRHGGTIRLESTLGNGSTFYFTLGENACHDSNQRMHR